MNAHNPPELDIMSEHPWPELPLDKWKDTYATLHMWTQMVGKVRLALTPRVNHWWEVPLYVNGSSKCSSISSSTNCWC